MKRVVVFIVLAMVVIGSCAAQSTTADQRIVGTWTQGNGTVWVFNANGTGTRDGTNFDYGISAGGEIHISGWNELKSNKSLYMSPDGRRMIIKDEVFIKK